MASRKELEEALRTGHHVRVPGRPEVIRHARMLPPDPAPTEADPKPAPLEGVVTRTPDGRLTHEGMTLALREGGAVLHMGEILDRPEHLPAPEEVAAGDEQRTLALASQLDAEIAALESRRKKLHAPKGGKDAPVPWTPPAPPDTTVIAAPAPPPEAPPAEEDEGTRVRRKLSHRREE